MNIVRNYQRDDNLRASFNTLSKKTFGIDFEEWYKKGLWQDSYEPIGLEIDGEIVANVSVNKLKFVVDGQEKKAMQIGTVMTDENHRGRGYSRILMETVLELYEEEYDVLYLFANSSVLDFYPKFGFRKVDYMTLSTKDKIEKNNRYTFRRLDIDKDVDLIKGFAKNRIVNSKDFDVKDREDVFLFYCLMVFSDNIYYSHEGEVIVLYSKEGDILYIHDILSKTERDYKDIIGSLVDEDTKEIKFGFNIDLKDLSILKKTIVDNNSVLYVKGELDNKVEVVHPTTAQA